MELIFHKETVVVTETTGYVHSCYMLAVLEDKVQHNYLFHVL